MVFIAPTRPLVRQQQEACQAAMGIPARLTAMLTGQLHARARAQEWAERRAFFTTPQVLELDLASGACDAARVVLLVVDEAHRASGEHAICKAADMLARAHGPGA